MTDIIRNASTPITCVKCHKPIRVGYYPSVARLPDGTLNCHCKKCYMQVKKEQKQELVEMGYKFVRVNLTPRHCRDCEHRTNTQYGKGDYCTLYNCDRFWITACIRNPEGEIVKNPVGKNGEPIYWLHRRGYTSRP